MTGAVLQTERLRLTPIGDADEDQLYALFRNPEVRRYLLDDALVSREWVTAEIRTSRERFRQQGEAGLWAIRIRNVASLDSPASPIVGFVGFRPFFDPPQLQLLYGLHPDAWGAGYATEAAAAVARHALETLQFVEIRAAADKPNAASQRVLERIGMQETESTDDGDAGTIFYRLGPAAERIRPCPNPRNCVSSLADEARARIDPFRLRPPFDASWKQLLGLIQTWPRTRVVEWSGAYVRAECRSRLFRFVDDLELALGPDGRVDVRSASRVGIGDLGVNRKRVDELRTSAQSRGIVGG